MDALFEESLDVMADGEKMMMMPTLCTQEPEWIHSKEYFLSMKTHFPVKK